MAAVTTTKSKLVALFKELSVDTAGEWDAPKLQKRAEGGLAKYLEPGQVLEGEVKELFDAIEAANKEQEDITVTDDTAPEPKKPAKKPAKETPAGKPAAAPTTANAGKKSGGSGGGKPAPAADPAPKKKPAAKRAGGWKPGDPPLPFDEARGPGVIRSLVDLLKAATPEKPLTKEKAVEELVAKFPDRKSEKIKTTVSNQIPSRLRIVRGIHVWSNAGGYWIDGDGKKPQKDRVRPNSRTKESDVPTPKSGGKPAATKTSPGAKPTGKPAAKPAASPVKTGAAGKGGKAVDAKKTAAGKAMSKAQGGGKKK